MSYPGSGGSWQPNDPNQPGSGGFPAQPGGYQQQPGGYPQQQGGYPQQPGGYPQTGPQQAQGGYPQTGPQQAQGYPQQPGYGQQGFPQTGPQPQYGGGFGAPPKKSRKGVIIGAIVAVIAIAAGSVITVMALNRSDVQTGAPNPTAAADSLVSAIGKGDVAGFLASLAPAETAAIVDLQKDMTEELKRLEVYRKDADPNKVGGEIKAENLKYDESAAEKVNERLTITKLVGGKLTITSDFSKIPLTEKFIETVFPRGIDAKPTREEVDIADLVKKNKGKPLRIATVKEGDQWYPSLFYTIADYWLANTGQDWPKQGIANKGAGSPQDAVKEMADAAADANLERVIELLPPDEMGVLHDLGPVLLEAAGRQKPSGVKINKFSGDTQDVTGGKKVIIKEVDVSVEGQSIKLKREGDCYSYSAEGQSEKFCASEVGQLLANQKMPADAKKALVNLASGMLKNTGIVTTQVDGKWYVSPLRSFTDIGITALKSLKSEDLYALLKMAK